MKLPTASRPVPANFVYRARWDHVGARARGDMPFGAIVAPHRPRRDAVKRVVAPRPREMSKRALP